MGEVVQMHAEPKDGDMAFALCSCKKEGVPFAAAAVVSDQPFIAHLKCPECEQVVPVVNGYIGAQE